VDVQLEVARRLQYCSLDDYQRVATRIDDIGRMLSGLLASLQVRVAP